MTTPEIEMISEIPRDLLHEILLKLPTKDAATSCCVSRLWRDSVRDPSFRELHARASHIISGAAEALLVSDKRGHDVGYDEASVFDVSSRKALCHATVPRNYGLANVCNGFLCFQYLFGDGTAAPALACNPVTGETLTLPDAPPLANRDYRHLFFVLGFSPPTNEYKLFRLSYNYPRTCIAVDVYTLGGSAGGWQKYSYLSVHRPDGFWPPVLIDGKLYVATVPCDRSILNPESPERILVVDVRTETCRAYRLPPYEISRLEGKPPVTAFELNGRLCFVAHVTNSRGRFKTIQFWVMSSPPPTDKDDFDSNRQIDWDLCYSFDMNCHYYVGCLCDFWLGGGEMLYQVRGCNLHKYDMTGRRSSAPNNGEAPADQQVKVSITPLSLDCGRWLNIYGGYRPTLLSPLTLQPQDDCQ